MIFKNPWYLIESEKEKVNLETELKKEVHKKHILFLYAQDAVALARNASDDNVIYKLNDGKFGLVHLTWVETAEWEKEFPFTKIFENISELMKAIEIEF